jgi:hypothetical protein
MHTSYLVPAGLGNSLDGSAGHCPAGSAARLASHTRTTLPCPLVSGAHPSQLLLCNSSCCRSRTTKLRTGRTSWGQAGQDHCHCTGTKGPFPIDCTAQRDPTTHLIPCPHRHQQRYETSEHACCCFSCIHMGQVWQGVATGTQLQAACRLKKHHASSCLPSPTRMSCQGDNVPRSMACVVRLKALDGWIRKKRVYHAMPHHTCSGRHPPTVPYWHLPDTASDHCYKAGASWPTGVQCVLPAGVTDAIIPTAQSGASAVLPVLRLYQLPLHLQLPLLHLPRHR